MGGHYVRLYAPRKYGKTSLLNRVVRDAERDEGLVPVIVDLYRVVSLSDVTIRFERAYAKQLKGSLRNRVEDFFQRTGLGISLGAFGIGAKIRFDRSPEPLAALHALLDLPLRLEEFGGYRALIALDEFQDIDKVNDLDGILRSHIQHQGQVASYVFAGSEPGLMRQLFENKDRPLYGSAVSLRLGRLPDPDVAQYIADRFAAGGRDVGEAVGPLLLAAKGHPQRSIMLAHHLWEQIDEGRRGTLEDWTRAHRSTMVELQAEFDARWRGFSLTEQKSMRAVIEGGGSPYRRHVLERLALEKATAQAAIERLLAAAELEVEDRKHLVVDPLFAEWIARVSSGEPEDL